MIKTYETRQKTILADGSVKYYTRVKQYETKNAGIRKKVLTEEMIEEIRKLAELRVPKKAIADKFGLSVYLVNSALRYNPTPAELKQFANDDAVKAAQGFTDE